MERDGEQKNRWKEERLDVANNRRPTASFSWFPRSYLFSCLCLSAGNAIACIVLLAGLSAALVIALMDVSFYTVYSSDSQAGNGISWIPMVAFMKCILDVKMLSVGIAPYGDQSLLSVDRRRLSLGWTCCSHVQICVFCFTSVSCVRLCVTCWCVVGLFMSFPLPCLHGMTFTTWIALQPLHCSPLCGV
jgi:hypothetical protein